MRKRRTKKDKEKAKHNFTFSWRPKGSDRESETSVKGQFPDIKLGEPANKPESKNVAKSAETDESPYAKREILKALSLALVILGVELVIYFAWS